MSQIKNDDEPDAFDSQDGRTYSRPVTAAKPGQADEPEIPVHSVQLYLCDPCLDGQGEECHTPGCSLWLNRVPDLPLRNNPGVTIIGTDVFAAQELQPAPELAAAIRETRKMRDVVCKLLDLFDAPDRRRMRHANVTAGTLERYAAEAGVKP